MPKKIPESAYETEESANREYSKERKQLKDLKSDRPYNGKQSENIKSDEERAGEKAKSDADFKELKKKVPSYKKGGRVRATGVALLHKGEKVMPKGKGRKMGRRKGPGRKK